jgi:hypothetical protein
MRTKTMKGMTDDANGFLVQTIDSPGQISSGSDVASSADLAALEAWMEAWSWVPLGDMRASGERSGSGYRRKRPSVGKPGASRAGSCPSEGETQ